MVKAIIFDFFGVVYSDEYWKQFKQDRDLVSNFKKLADKVNLGHMPWQKFVERIAKEIGKTVDEIHEAYAAESINIPLVDYIAELREKYKTALLSNAAYEFFEPRAKEIGFDKLFDYTAISSQLGVIKPDPKIYQHVLEELGVKPGEAVYIDDVPRFVEAARNLGMPAIRYENFPQMKAELEKILAASSNN